MKQSGRTETSITTIKAAVKNTENRTGENNVTFELKKKNTWDFLIFATERYWV
jgi:hypothetical protein